MSETPVIIALDRIRPSPLNPRKHFDQTELEQLADTIRLHGVLQTILVRPIRSDRPLLDDFTLLMEIAGVHTQSASMDCANKLHKLGTQTYGQLKQRAKLHKDDIYAAIRTSVGVTVAEAKALQAAVKAAENDPRERQHQFELVDGERRFRAAKLAGLGSIEAKVREFTDAEALQIMVVANDQRADTSPLEKADGYAALMDRGQSVEQIAAAVGKSVSSIRSLLKLRALPATARKALAAGELSPSVAGLIARVPGEAARKTCFEETLNAHHWDRFPPSFRDVKEHIEEYFTVELKGAPFDRLSLEVLPSAGSCEDCPKRVGNLQETDPEGYAGFRADCCTDPDCYRQKVEAWKAQTLALAKASGQKLLSDTEAKKAFPYGNSLPYGSPYVDLAATCYEDRKHRTYGEVLKGKLSDEDIVLAIDPKDSLHRLAKKEKAAPFIKGLASKGSTGRGATLSEANKAERKKRAAENKLRAAVSRAVLAKAASETEALFHWLVPDGGRGNGILINQILRVLATHMVGTGWGSVRDEVLARRECKGQRTAERIDELEGQIAAMGAAQLLGLVVELLAGRLILGYHEAELGKTLKTALGIDKAKIEREVKEQLRQEKAGKPSTNGKAHKREDAGEPVEDLDRPSCQLCGCATGLIVDNVQVADSPDDLVPVEVLAEELHLEDISQLVPGAVAGSAWVCMSCVDKYKKPGKRKKVSHA